jgi:hypothetical protein
MIAPHLLCLRRAGKEAVYADYLGGAPRTATGSRAVRRRLRPMKPRGILVNISGGPIVEEAALVAALRSGHLAPGRAGNAIWLLCAETDSPPGPPGRTAPADGQHCRRPARDPRATHADVALWKGDVPYGRDSRNRRKRIDQASSLQVHR